MITYIDRVCISVAGPEMQKQLDIKPSLWGWILSVFAISYAAFEIPSGAMGDRIGPRKVLTRIVLWWSVFTSLTGVARSHAVLLATRFLFGAGEAGAYPNSSAAISRWFPAGERARAQGIVWMASRVGGAVSPLLVIPIQQRWGWRASFYVFGVLGTVWAAVWYLWFRDTPAQKPEVSKAELEEIGPPALRSHQGLPWRIALRSANFWAILLMYHTYCWGSFFFLTWMPTYLASGRGFDSGDLRHMAWIPFCMGGCANFLGGFASDRLIQRIGLKWGRRAIAITGLSVAAAFTFLTIFVTNKLVSVVFLGFAYAGSDFMLPVAWAVCLDVGRKYAGAVTGAMNTAGQIGSFFLATAFGYLVERYHSYDAPLIPMSVMVLISALLWFKIDPTRQLVPEEQAVPASHV